MNKNLLTTLFSFDGRMRRSHYWAVRLGGAFAVGMAWILVVALVGLLGGEGRGGLHAIAALGGGLVTFAMFIAYIWMELAAGVKRCHDRNKSGWFLLIGLIPLVGAVWLLIELGFLDGEPERNTYGPSPKFPETAANAFA